MIVGYAQPFAPAFSNALESEQNAQLSAEDAAVSKAISIQQANRAEEQAMTWKEFAKTVSANKAELKEYLKIRGLKDERSSVLMESMA